MAEPTAEQMVTVLSGNSSVPESINGAAVKIGNNIFQGINHAEAATQAAKALGMPIDEVFKLLGDEEGGFLTSNGRYVGRQEANTLAQKADQLANKDAVVKWLTVENLKGHPLAEKPMARMAPVGPLTPKTPGSGGAGGNLLPWQ